MPVGSAAQTYAAYADAFNEQRRRFYGDALEREPAPSFARGARSGFDPRRPLDPAQEIIASYLQPNDVLVDVGGGPGRLALPLALRCREVIDVDLSTTFGAQFEDSARDAAIDNARFVHSDWLEVDGIQGDVALMSNVTYFVRDIDRFVSKWQDATRRRILIIVALLSGRDLNADLFRLVFGEDLHPAPALRELLPALWELGVYPELLRLPSTGPRPALPQTKDEAIQSALEQLPVAPPPNGADTLAGHFEELFASTPEGYRARWRPSLPNFLVTWELGPA
jgi:hypothetical protein